MTKRERLQAWEDYIRSMKADLEDAKKLSKEITEKLESLRCTVQGQKPVHRDCN